jgi:hypothetical protein
LNLKSKLFKIIVITSTFPQYGNMVGHNFYNPVLP